MEKKRAELLAPVVVGGIACTYLLQVRLQRQPTRLVGQLQIGKLVMCHNQNSCSWVQYCWAKVQPNYNWNNVYFIGCLLINVQLLRNSCRTPTAPLNSIRKRNSRR